jgi:cell volume regulation protein A
LSDYELILVAGLLLAAGLLAAKAADRVRVPGLLLFLGVGMLLGSEGPGGIDFTNYELARTLGTIGLILILFEGGLTAGWHEIRPVIGTAVSLATIGTVVTAVITGFVAVWLFNLSTLEGMLIGSAVAATDSAAIFAVLRGSHLRKPLARALEGESGFNDPVALLLVTGFIEWIQNPEYGIWDLEGSFLQKMAIGVALGIAIGHGARWCFRNLDLPNPGLYPVASIATVSIAYGLPELVHGSGFISVYITALVLGTGPVPARPTITAFHQGLGWVSQIALFGLLGLLVFPSGLVDVAGEGLLLSAALIFVARPAAAFAASVFSPFNNRERLMLGWAGLRGAIPIWLATFPVVANIGDSETIFNTIFFVVVTSTLIQGTTFEPLAKRLGVVSDEASLPPPLIETGIIRELGAESFVWRIREGDAAAGVMAKELELPREALVNLIVRDGEALPPRGSTELLAGDELHIVARLGAMDDVQKLAGRWRDGPLGEPPVPPAPLRGASQVFTVRPWSETDGDPSAPAAIAGIPVAGRLRVRRDGSGSLITLADGRYAATSADLLAVGGRRRLAEWCARRVTLEGLNPADRAWWQELAGALSAPAPPPDPER